MFGFLRRIVPWKLQTQPVFPDAAQMPHRSQGSLVEGVQECRTDHLDKPTPVERDIENAKEHLRRERFDGNFVGQLSTYKELARLCSASGSQEDAVSYLEKAVLVAEYLRQYDDADAILHSLLNIHDEEGNLDAIVEVYGLLHLLWSLHGDEKKSRQYNDKRLRIIAKRIGKQSPSFDERVAYEVELSARNMESVKKRYLRVVSGEEAPTLPDEHVEACRYLVQTMVQKGRHEEAFQIISICEKTMRQLDPSWASPGGMIAVRELKKLIN